MGIEKNNRRSVIRCRIKQKPCNNYNHYPNGRINHFEVTCFKQRNLLGISFHLFVVITQ